MWCRGVGFDVSFLDVACACVDAATDCTSGFVSGI